MSATISSLTPPLSTTPTHSRKKVLHRPRNRQQTNSTTKQLETLSQSPITKTSTRTPTTSLTTRMRQKQHKLQALRGSAEKFPSQIPNLVEASPATPPTWRHSHSSPDGESTKYPSKLTRYDYSRSHSADFDGRRYRALQREMTRAGTTSRDFVPPKRLQLLSSLPSQALSPQATKALRQLAKEKQATPPPLTLKRRRLVLEPLVPTTPTGFRDVQHQPPRQDRGLAEQTLSPLYMWVATATLHTSLVLYVYLLMLVFGMLLCCSDNPCQETVRGYQALGAGVYGVATTIQEEIRWREWRGHSVGIWHESVVWGQHTMITIETIVSTHLWRLQTSSDVMLEGSHHLAPVQREAMHSAHTEEKDSLRNDMSVHHNTIDQSVGILDSGDSEADACYCQNNVVDLLAGQWDQQIMTTPLLKTSTVGVPLLATEPGEQQEFSGDENWWAPKQSDERIGHISELIRGANLITLAFGT